MDASDLIKTLQNTLRGGGRPHMGEGQEGVVQRRMGYVRLLVDELAAHAMPGRQIADCRRSRQRLNGQVLTITLGQPRCRASVSIHTRTTPKGTSVPSSVVASSTRLRV